MKTRTHPVARIFVAAMAFTQFVVGGAFTGTAVLFAVKWWLPTFIKAREAGALEGPVLFVLIAGGIFSLLFLGAGLAVLVASSKMLAKAWRNEPLALRTGRMPRSEGMINGRIKSRSTFRFKLSGDGSFAASSRALYGPITIFVLIMALLWNTFLAFQFQGGTSQFSILFVVFQTPFLVIGLGLVALAGYLLLALRHPPIELRIFPGEQQRQDEKLIVRPGENLSLSWRLKGDRGQLAHLTISIEARGFIPDGSGFRPKTASQTVADKIDLRSAKQGQLTVSVPEVDTKTNELFIHCHASAPFAPDVWLLVPIDWAES